MKRVCIYCKLRKLSFMYLFFQNISIIYIHICKDIYKDITGNYVYFACHKLNYFNCSTSRLYQHSHSHILLSIVKSIWGNTWENDCLLVGSFHSALTAVFYLSNSIKRNALQALACTLSSMFGTFLRPKIQS